MGIPFADALWPEVTARIAYRLVVRKFNSLHSPQIDPVLLVQLCRIDLDDAQLPLVETALTALQFFLIRKEGRARDWRDRAIALSRYGYGFRRCFYDDYKANRRPDPRVTNRRVRLALPEEQGPARRYDSRSECSDE